MCLKRGIIWAVLTLVTVLFLPATRADADPIIYSWSGFTEGVGSDPFGFGGDGQTSTISDGMPFTLSVTVDSEAVDQSGIGNSAVFTPESVELTIGGTAASVPANTGSISFSDDNSSFDSITYSSNITFNAVTDFWGAFVGLDDSTFDLLDTGPDVADPPPVFGNALNLGNPSRHSSLKHLSLVPMNTTVSSVVVPEPHAIVSLSIAALCALLARRFDDGRKTK